MQANVCVKFLSGYENIIFHEANALISSRDRLGKSA